MKASFRVLAAALIVVAIVFAASAATAQIIGPGGGGQFPTCASGNLVINNHTFLPVDVCIKYLPCINVPANNSVTQVLPPGTPIPGIGGFFSNTTYQWTPNPAPPNYWIPSLSLGPSGRCFNVFFDEANCTIDIFQAAGPPCINP